ncbi:MAG TPA: carboxypeptidase-like regulatory domain-containing protein [Gemmatimonadales bacterium]|nr:carboxypeptidase-like regulatory domain-containing protein [Gemmatimonadales bacterium]
MPALVALATFSARRLPAQVPDTAATEVIVDLAFRAGPEQVVVALARDSVVLLPVNTFLALAEIKKTQVLIGHQIGGIIEPAGIPYLFDTEGQIARRGDSTMVLPAASARWRGSELYVATSVIGWMFDVDVRMDWSALTVHVTRTDSLPVVLRQARERRRKALLAAEAQEEAAAPLIPTPIRAADGAALDWGLTTATRDPAHDFALQLALGAQVAGGGLDIQELANRTPGAWSSDTRASWVRAWDDRDWLRQIRIGDVFSGGRQPRPIRGAAVTNAPYLRLSSFGVEPLIGSLAPGWEIEAYRGQNLLGYQSVGPDGRYMLSVPVDYGSNPLELVGYGPNGQIARSLVTFQVPTNRLPARHFEYSFSGGECSTDPCTAHVNGDLRYAPSNRITFQAGTDYFVRDTLPSESNPYLGVFANATRSISLGIEGVLHAQAAASISYDPSPNLHAGIAHTRFAHGTLQPLVGSAIDAHRTTVSLFWRPPLPGGTFYLQGSASHAVGATETRDAALLNAVTRIRGVRLGLGGTYMATRPAGAATSTDIGVRATVDAALTGPTHWLRSTFVSGLIGVASHVGLTQIGLGVGRQLYGPLRADASTYWINGQGMTINFSLTTYLPSLRAVARNSYTPSTGIQGSEFFEGSVLWNARDQTLSFDNGQSVGRAGITGRAFVDQNDNGQWDPGEPVLPGLRVRIGSQAIATDSSGRFTIWDLVPFTTTTVEVDTLSIADPLIVPQLVTRRLTLLPNTFRDVPIPFVQGGEVSGTVMFPDGRGVPTVDVELRERETGAVTHTTTFSDGTFYTYGVRPGRYTVTLAPAVLDRLEMNAVAATFEIPKRGTNKTVEGVTVRLVKRK